MFLICTYVKCLDFPDLKLARSFSVSWDFPGPELLLRRDVTPLPWAVGGCNGPGGGRGEEKGEGSTAGLVALTTTYKEGRGKD